MGPKRLSMLTAAVFDRLPLTYMCKHVQCAKTNGDWVAWEQTSDRSVQVAKPARSSVLQQTNLCTAC